MYGSYTYNFGFGRPGFGFGRPGYRYGYPGFRFWPSNHIEPSAPPICPPPYPGTEAELQQEFNQPPFIISEFSSERIATGPFPVRTECPLCKQEVLTETYSSAGLLAWLLGGGLCLIGCSLGCCLIPCCIDACRDVVHKCPSCKQQIALFKRL